MAGSFDVYLRRVVENGKTVFPEAFCLTEVERKQLAEQGKFVESVERLKQTNGAWHFTGQYLNDPVDQESVEFKQAWFHPLIYTPELSAKLSKVRAVISIDPAFRLNQSNDYSGIVASKTTEDNTVYILEAKQIRLDPKGLIDEIFRLVDQYPEPIVLVETWIAQIMLVDLLRAEMAKRNKWFLIQEVEPSNRENKAVRIRALIPHYANGRIYHAPGLAELEGQLTEFPRGVHDDIIDALAYQIPFWKANQTTAKSPGEAEGSYSWWQKKIPKRPMRLGSLFNDFQ